MATLLTEKAAQDELKHLPGWDKKGKEISRLYTFSGFVPAMAFVNHVAGLAEHLDHHPDILIQYSKVRLTLSTHSEGGLTDLDFKLARQIDA